MIERWDLRVSGLELKIESTVLKTKGAVIGSGNFGFRIQGT